MPRRGLLHYIVTPRSITRTSERVSKAAYSGKRRAGKMRAKTHRRQRQGILRTMGL